ncbi:MAG: hypothetical protein ABFD52_07805 [Acidobacteriota bacterium]
MRNAARVAGLAVLAGIGIFALAGPVPGAEIDRAALGKKQETLTAEYGLAKDAKFYFVFDVRGHKLELRVRGMVLRSWPIVGMRFWGRPEFSGMVELTRKTTLKAPERIIIKPGQEEALVKVPAPAPKPGAAAAAAPVAADYDLEALEIRDMPTRFSMDFDNGLHVSLAARSGEAPGLIARLKEAWRWYIALPLGDVFGRDRQKARPVLELVFEDEKAPQGIYWHFFDGIKGIIL